MKNRIVLFASGTILFLSFPILTIAGGAFFIDDTTGNVGIGTINPSARLSVNGTASSTSLYISSLATLAGAFLAVDGSGQIIATTSPSSSGATSHPTFQTLTSTATSTYTTPQGVTELYIRMCGGGGGGGGRDGAGTNGSNTIWGNIAGSTFTTANGGLGGTTNAVRNGGLGGTGGSTNLGMGVIRVVGGGGGSGSAVYAGEGGIGGSSPFGGAGAGVSQTNGVNAGPNSCSGGSAGANSVGGGGGGAGEYVEFVITSPASSYEYAVGAKGVGTGATYFGGDGADGVVIVEEFYH